MLYKHFVCLRCVDVIPGLQPHNLHTILYTSETVYNIVYNTVYNCTTCIQIVYNIEYQLAYNTV